MAKKSAKKAATKKTVPKPATKRRRTAKKPEAPAHAVTIEVLPRKEEGFLNMVLSGTKLVGEKLWEHRTVIIEAVALVVGELIAKKATSTSKRPRLR